MYRNLFSILIVAALLTLASCGNKDKAGLPVPRDAGFVFHLNLPSLSSKLTWQEIKNSEWFKEVYEKSSPDSMAQKLMEDPGNSGINTQADVIFFTRNRGQGGYIVVEGTLTNPAAFESFNKQMDKTGSITAKKDGDITILSNSKGENIATHDGTHFAYVIDAPGMNMGMGREQYSGMYRFPSDSLVAFAKELYNLKGDNSLSNDKKYTSLVAEPGDMHMWMNAQNLYGGMLSNMLSMMKAGVLLDGTITTATFNFDNGKIVMNAKTYYNEELGKIYEKYRMKNFDTDAFNRVPSQNICAAFAMNYPPDGLKEFMKVIGVDGWVNSFMGDMGYSMDEFVKANKGDVLLTVSDFDLKKQTVTIPPSEEGGQPYTYTKTTPDVKVLFACSVNDKPAFDKMISVLKAKIGEIPEGNGFPKITYSLNDKWFAAGNAEEQVNGFLAGSSSNKQAFVSKLSGHPLGFYVDLQKILKTSEAAEDSTSSSKAMLAESIKMWEDVVMTGGELKDGAMTGSLVINLVDKNTNSLKQLNQYIERMHSSGSQKRGF